MLRRKQCVQREARSKEKIAKKQVSDRGDIVLREDFVRNVLVMTSVQSSDESEPTHLSSNA